MLVGDESSGRTLIARAGAAGGQVHVGIHERYGTRGVHDRCGKTCSRAGGGYLPGSTAKGRHVHREMWMPSMPIDACMLQSCSNPHSSAGVVDCYTMGEEPGSMIGRRHSDGLLGLKHEPHVFP